jgi:hypothetical protein
MFKFPSFLLTMELTEDYTDDSALEDICKELFTTTVQLAMQSRSLDKQFTTLLKRVQEKPLGSILSPKAATGRWLQSIGIPHDMISYDDFLTSFFSMYEKEGRLDFATRTIELRPTEAKLLELPADQPISVFQFLGSLPRIFN